MEEFEYIMSVGEKHEAGKWIVVVGKRIVAQGDDAREVFEKAKKSYPDRELFIIRVPFNANMLL